MSNSANPQSPFLVIGLGEALFDCFPDKTLLGGAPVNFAFHAHQLLRSSGGQGIVVSCIGEDELGEDLRKQVQSRGMDATYLQETSAFSTGTVEVELDAAGQPSYTITPNVAWDHLEFTRDLADLANRCSAICFGTLAQRSMDTRATIQKFLSAAPSALKVCDINLRQEFFSEDLLEESLLAADVAKLNEQELQLLVDRYGFAPSGVPPEEQLMAMLQRFGLQYLVYTRGAAGTVLFTPGERIEGQAIQYPKDAAADSVGAGDACCAGILVGLLKGLPLQEVVGLANHLGAFVAARQGGTPKIPPEILALANS